MVDQLSHEFADENVTFYKVGCNPMMLTLQSLHQFWTSMQGLFTV